MTNMCCFCRTTIDVELVKDTFDETVNNHIWWVYSCEKCQIERAEDS